jgi:4-amino-4-deoxy-L-arabinose transferase-like glycosyltransferase
MVLCLLAAAALRLPGLTRTPPGLHYDEAANAVLTSEIAFAGARPVFISSYTGKEVLFFYLAGGLMRLVGPSVFSLRLTAALIGLLTVAATYWLGRAMLADRRVAVLAAVLLAFSFWHLVLSRLGFRAISQPLLQALAVAALFRGLQRPQWRWFLLSGLFLGLAGYTYLAVRLFPLLLLLSLAPVLVASRQRLSQLAVVALVALIVLAPLLFYFARNPDAFWVRIGQVAPDASLSAGESYLRSLGMFFLSGDPYWRFNLPGRPLFSWFWGGLGLVGWLSLFWRWRRWWYDWQKGSVLLLLLAPLLMLLPTALAVGEIVPSNLRAIGLIPFIFFLPALGLLLLLQQLGGLLRRPDLPLGRSLRRFSLFDGYELNVTFLFLLILLLGTARTERLYFEEWATRADLFYDSDADLAAVARFLDEEAPPADHLYVAALHYRHPTVAFLSERYEEIRWLPGSQALPLPAAGSALYVFPHSSPAPRWAEEILATRAGCCAGPTARTAGRSILPTCSPRRRW